MKKLLITLFALSLVGWSQPGSTTAERPRCPVSISDVRSIDSRIFISFKNTSGKVITRYRFGLVFYDLDREAHYYPETFSQDKVLAPNGTRNDVWDSSSTLDYLYPTAKAYLIDIFFGDGSDWNDDGSQGCHLATAQE